MAATRRISTGIESPSALSPTQEIRFGEAKMLPRRLMMATAIAETKDTRVPSYQRAPPGFTREQWQFFDQEGYLLIDDAIPAEDVHRYIEATNRIAAEHLRRNPGKPFTPWEGIAHLDP